MDEHDLFNFILFIHNTNSCVIKLIGCISSSYRCSFMYVLVAVYYQKLNRFFAATFLNLVIKWLKNPFYFEHVVFELKGNTYFYVYTTS